MSRLAWVTLMVVAGCGGVVGGVAQGGADGGRGGDAPGTVDVDAGATPPDAEPRACTVYSTCPNGQACAFSAALACGWDTQRCATGTCKVPLAPMACGAVSIVHGCGCDNEDVTWKVGCAALFPEGFAPVPFAHLGACVSGKPCASSAECGSGESCRFPAGGGCSAKGECVSEQACNCDNACCSSTFAPACDGTPASVDCRGFSTKPVCPGQCE